MAGRELIRELALRIGLAAKVLPGVDVRRLLNVLNNRIGVPLTEEKLGKMTVTDLKDGLSALDGDEHGEDADIDMEYFKLAVRYLWGEDVTVPALPVIQVLAEVEMPGSIRVALASNGGERLNGHFGSCSHFLIYQLSEHDIRLIDIRMTAGVENAEDKNAFRVDLIADCHLVYVQSIGGPAAAKVIKVGIYPLKMVDGGHASEVLAQLQEVMVGHPPPWLAKAMGRTFEQSLRYTAAEA